MHQLARGRAELPGPPPGQVAQKQRRAQQHESICQSQIQHQDTSHRALPYPAQHWPDHEQIPGEAQDEGQGQDGDADLSWNTGR